ncbi:hypothetical protein CPC08DRAFT_771421 [Agrocybe pediades]|nr:hypothetical protein CPC08DRAFT_771421 [Agrocybe pediades]
MGEEQLVERQEFALIENQEEFGIYYRSFSVIADYLLKKDRLSRREASSYFLSGFHIEFRNQIRRQLRAENPRRYHDDFFTVEEIRDVTVFLLGGERHTNTLTADSTVHSQGSTTIIVPDTPYMPSASEWQGFGDPHGFGCG